MLTTTPGSVEDPTCSSGNGFLSLEGYVKVHRPSLICLENVKALFAARKVEGGESALLSLKTGEGVRLNF